MKANVKEAYEKWKKEKGLIDKDVESSESEKQKASRWACQGLGAGILSIVLSWTFLFGLIAGLIAIIHYRWYKKVGVSEGNGLATAGFVTGLIGIIFSVAMGGCVTCMMYPTIRNMEASLQDKPAINESYTNETSYSQPQEKREWVFVYEMRAKNDKQSLAFFLEGGQQTVLYRVQGGYFSLRVVPEGTQPNTFSHGVVRGLARHGLNDQTIMRKSRGYYYLDLSFGGGDATIQIYEYR